MPIGEFQPSAVKVGSDEKGRVLAINSLRLRIEAGLQTLGNPRAEHLGVHNRPGAAWDRPQYHIAMAYQVSAVVANRTPFQIL